MQNAEQAAYQASAPGSRPPIPKHLARRFDRIVRWALAEADTGLDLERGAWALKRCDNRSMEPYARTARTSDVRRARRASAIAVVLAAISFGVAARQVSTAPRFVAADLPNLPPQALGGGEVVLELMVDGAGRVTGVDVIRSTPPYTDLIAGSALSWRFEPARRVVKEDRVAESGRVLVAAYIRPPALYAAPAPGAPADIRGSASKVLPQPQMLTAPAYPPNAVGSGLVLVEIEMTGRGALRGYRVVSPASGFDDAALDAVRVWRFSAPLSPETPEQIFVYALVGFREPVAGAVDFDAAVTSAVHSPVASGGRE